MAVVVQTVGVVLLAAATLAPALAQTAPARPALPEVPGVTEGLVTIEIGNAIRRRCPDISAKFFAGISYMIALKEKAVRAGYSEEEIRAFLDDRTEQAEVRALADAWLGAKGASRADADSLCAVGEAEIDAGTELGRLLQRNVK